VTSISANIVVRNEAHRIERLLQVLKPYVTEIVIVDQESTDNTVEICKKYTDKVYTDICTGHADSSRQLAMDKSISEWILVLDADEMPTQRFLDDLPVMIKGRADGHYVSLCQLRVKSLNEVPLDYLLGIGWYIHLPHEALPNCYRLFRNGHVSIGGELHTGVRPRHQEIVQYNHYNAIVEIKTFQEHKLDIDRYEDVRTGKFKK